MRNFYSPLRYPGGKHRLAKFISQVCVDNHINGCYVEPFAGGASVALYLLFENKVNRVVINDLDRSIYAFWYSVLNNTDELCLLIDKTPVTIASWRKQKAVQKNKANVRLLDLGFSTLFLNRTNFSGIIMGGPIGGIQQNSVYKLGCRFNKELIIEKIQNIAKKKKSIELYNLDCIELVQKFQNQRDKNTIFYFDPPYYTKGRFLYFNSYQDADHQKLADTIKEIKNTHWIVSYDNNKAINDIYSWVKNKKYFSLKHFANQTKTGQEVLFLKSNLSLDNNLKF